MALTKPTSKQVRIKDALGVDKLLYDLPTNAGASMVGFLPSGAGAIVTNVQNALDWQRYAFRYMTPAQAYDVLYGVASIDVTAALQAAINNSNSLLLPVGCKAKITASLTIPTSGCFVDLSGSELILDTAVGSASHIVIGGQASKVNSVTLKNITAVRTQTATSGYAFDFNDVGVATVESCRIYGNNKVSSGIRVYKGVIVNLVNNYIDNCVNYGVYLEGVDAGAGRTIDCRIRGCRIEGGISAINSWDYVEGLFVRENIFFNTSGTAVSVNASSDAAGLVSMKFQQNDFDTCGGSGIYIDKVANVQLSDNWFSSITDDCVQVKQNAHSCIVTDNQIYPTARGMLIEADSCVIADNLISGGTSAITFTSTSNGCNVTGNLLTGSQYACQFGSASNVLFANNEISSISVMQFTGLDSPNLVMKNNAGDSAIGNAAYVTVGASPFTYTTGAYSESISVLGGAVSTVAMDGVNLGFSGNTYVNVPPHKSITITYTGAPFVARVLS